MFTHHDLREARHRRRDEHLRIARDLVDELRRNPGHRGHRGPGLGPRDFFGGRRGGLVRRGEVRPLILRALRDRPMHGYELIQELEGQSGGRWRPSAGSIYPTLQQLADEGLVSGAEVDGRRVYTLTDAGRQAADESVARSPWADSDVDDAREPDLFRELMQLSAATVQVNRIGSPDVRRKATATLSETRKQLYRLLSEDEDVTEAAGEDVEA